MIDTTHALRELIISEIGENVRRAKSLLLRIESNQWKYKPSQDMRTMLELAHHLVLIPVTDLAILGEKEEGEIQRISNEIKPLVNTNELIEIMENGFVELKSYMMSLSEDDFLNKLTKPYYSNIGYTQAKWLLDILSHTYLHCVELYNYLRNSGQKFNFYEL